MEINKGLLRCKIVVVGDTQCGKTALLHVFAKDSYPENYVPTVFENYTASFEIDKQRIELNMWDTSGRTHLVVYKFGCQPLTSLFFSLRFHQP
ncbi:hypothetical protein FQN60_003105, partial [Etheostoma spectabile]